jgi:hypothetical protein
MKIGTSYSRCMVDIIEGKVKEDEVMVIITRTDFDPNISEQWESIWLGYTDYREWSAYKDREQEFLELTQRMYNNGQIHQPRKFGAFVSRSREIWYDLVLTSEVKDSNPAVKKAWDQYKMLANLI